MNEEQYNWIEAIEKVCSKYNIELKYLPAIISDSKVLPMIRGKAFEFSALSKFVKILNYDEWDVSKLQLNPQFGYHDEDVTITHFSTGKKITVECKLAAKGRFKFIPGELLKDGYFQIAVKCMRSRTLGKTRIKALAPVLGVSEDVLEIHNDQYRENDFDIVVTSIANAFYETDNQGEYIWQPNDSAVSFLKELAGDSSLLHLENPDVQRDFAFEKVYVARSSTLAVKSENSVKCSRKKCQNKLSCGFIPNYPVIKFKLGTGKPLPPWFQIEDCLPVLSSCLNSQ